MKIEEWRSHIESGHINFLFGAGTSSELLGLLGPIEKEINTAQEDKESKKEEELLKGYCEQVMLPNVNVLQCRIEDCPVLKSYEYFFKVMLDILLKRKSTILNKQVNIFTTNIDILMEKTLTDMKLTYNDGFYGGYNKRYFDIGSYQRIFQQRSMHYDFVSEVPVFNIIKLHGSLSWRFEGKDNKQIILRNGLSAIHKGLEGKLEKDSEKWLDWYKDNILVINPGEAKHLETTINFQYSDLLRFYSNVLEKENSLLFVIGFSMQDEHIRKITMKVARSNPTLQVYIFCYDKDAAADIINICADIPNNFHIIVPGATPSEESVFKDVKHLSLQSISENLFKLIPKKVYERA